MRGKVHHYRKGFHGDPYLYGAIFAETSTCALSGTVDA